MPLALLAMSDTSCGVAAEKNQPILKGFGYGIGV
jgi:hypothetical protein